MGVAKDSVMIALADGFDFPVGKPDAAGYRKARGFYPVRHLGEDWNGTGGGNTDLGDPIYNIGRGIVVLSEDVKRGWGNVVIVRHAFRDHDGAVRVVDSLYGHLQERKVELYDKVEKGQLVGTMGSNRGMYYAHLHFEIRKNLEIGMNRSKFKQDYSNYYSPTSFIKAHRKLTVGSRNYPVPVDNFEPYDPKAAMTRSIDLPDAPEKVAIPLISKLKKALGGGDKESEEEAAPEEIAAEALRKALADESIPGVSDTDRKNFLEKLKKSLGETDSSGQ
jgi:hypothetical protein